MQLIAHHAARTVGFAHGNGQAPNAGMSCSRRVRRRTRSCCAWTRAYPDRQLHW